MLKVNDLTFSYNKSNAFAFPDMECGKGEHWLIMGESGCGKTTFLHLLAGLLRPTGGEIVLNGQDIAKLPGTQVDSIRGTEIGIVFQTPHFIQSLNVKQNLLIARYLNGQKENKQPVAGELLETLGLQDKENSRVNNLSQGELQRLSIARAIMNHPSLILADEPTSSLDDKNCEEAIRLLKTQAEKTQASLLIVTHDHRLNSYFQHVINL